MTQSNRWSKSFLVSICLMLLLIRAVSMRYVALLNIRDAVQDREYPGDLRLLMAMRKLYPIVPLGERLPGSTAVGAMAPVDMVLSDDAQRELTEYESHLEKSLRRYLLTRLHEETFAKFVESNGFGRSRMWFGLTLDDIKRPNDDQPLVPFNDRTLGSSTSSLVSAAEPTSAELLKLPAIHRAAIFEFVEPSRLGQVPKSDDISKTVTWTFDSSQVRQETKDWSQIPADSPLRPLSVAHTEHGMSAQAPLLFANRLADWQLSRLELVSLLKAPQPQVYLSRNLPNMKELNRAPTRPLDKFESNNLQKLREGEHLVIEFNSTEIRMLGGIRAANQCVECHRVQHGYLLGAFTYILRHASASIETSQANLE